MPTLNVIIFKLRFIDFIVILGFLSIQLTFGSPEYLASQEGGGAPPTAQQPTKKGASAVPAANSAGSAAEASKSTASAVDNARAKPDTSGAGEVSAALGGASSRDSEIRQLQEALRAEIEKVRVQVCGPFIFLHFVLDLPMYPGFLHLYIEIVFRLPRMHWRRNATYEVDPKMSWINIFDS